MVSFSIAKTATTVARLAGCAALFGLLGAPHCEGQGYVQTGPVVPSFCVLQNPINNPNPAAGSPNDVLQLADPSNVNNDFIRCRISKAFDSANSVNVIVYVSSSDAQGHWFVDSGQPVDIVNLSR